MNLKVFFFGILILLCVNLVAGATLHGTVYDPFLNPQPDARVEINTEPKQVYISKQGDYSFEVSEGDYSIRVEYFEDGSLIYAVTETISIVSNGDFVLDLILFPEFEEEEIDIVDFPDHEKDYSLHALAALVIVIVLVGVLVAYSYKKVSRMVNQDFPDDDISANVLEFIKQRQGRVTQKEIRKEFPSSEAKISLVLTELQQKGRIEKIKKGRGNIIILK